MLTFLLSELLSTVLVTVIEAVFMTFFGTVFVTFVDSNYNRRIPISPTSKFIVSPFLI